MVKNVTLTIEDGLLKKARDKASAQHKTLNLLFREWVRQYVGACQSRSQGYYDLMKKLKHVNAGRKFSREELNER